MAFSFSISSKGLNLSIGKANVPMSVPHTTSTTSINASFLSSTIDFFDINSKANVIKAINECPQVSSILFRKAQATTNGITSIVDKKGRKIAELSTKGRELQRLIDKPNLFQSRAQFKALMKVFLGSFGWCCEYKEVSVGFGIRSRRILNPQYCKIEWKKKSLFHLTDLNSLISKFTYTEGGIETTITDVENLYFYTCSNILSESDGYLPVSPLKTLKNDINIIVKVFKTMGRSVSQPWGILSNETKDSVGDFIIDAKKKAQLRDELRNSYGTEHDGQSEVIILDHAASWQSIMHSIGDQQLLQILESSKDRICDVMGYPKPLLSNDKGTTFNNMGEGGKMLYQNHIIPECKSEDEQEMESLASVLEGYSIVTDFSHVPAMQEDRKEASEVLRNNVQALVTAYRNNQCMYDDMVKVIGVSEPCQQLKGKYWIDLSDEERALFDNMHIQNNNTNTNGSDNSGSGSPQGESGQNEAN
jgi:hypothetical protein